MSMRRILKCKTGTVLTEALISMFIIAILFVSISTAVTVASANTKRLQEVNDTSAHAQKIVDCLYSIAKSDSEEFFKLIEYVQTQYEDGLRAGAPAEPCTIDMYSLMEYIESEKANGNMPANAITLYDLLGFNSPTDDYVTKEKQEYAVALYLLPSYTASENLGVTSVNYFVSYNPYLTETGTGGRAFSTGLFPEIYTFKIVVSKTVQPFGNAITDYTQSSPASVTYIFQIAMDGGDET